VVVGVHLLLVEDDGERAPEPRGRGGEGERAGPLPLRSAKAPSPSAAQDGVSGVVEPASASVAMTL